MKRGSHTFALLIIMFSILNFSSLLSAGNIPDLPPTDQDPCTFGDGNIGPCIPEDDFITYPTGYDSSNKCVWTWCGPDTVEECVDPRLDTSTCVSKTNKGNCKCGGPDMGGGGCKNSKNELCDPTSGDQDCKCTKGTFDEGETGRCDPSKDPNCEELTAGSGPTETEEEPEVVGTFSLIDFEIAIENEQMRELIEAFGNLGSEATVMGANGNGEVFGIYFSLETDAVKFATPEGPEQDEEGDEKVATTEGGPVGDFCVAMASGDIETIYEKEGIEMQFLCTYAGYAFGGKPFALIGPESSAREVELIINFDVYIVELDRDDLTSLSKLASKHANASTSEKSEPIFGGSFELIYKISPEDFQLMPDIARFEKVSKFIDERFPPEIVSQFTEAEAEARAGTGYRTPDTATSCRSASAITADQDNPRASQSTLLILLLIILSILRFHHKKQER